MPGLSGEGEAAGETVGPASRLLGLLRDRNFILALAITLLAPLASAADKPRVPDFSAGDPLPKDAHHDWNLGPTGARGWVHAWRGESTDSRQILITAVDAGSPADGVLAKNDVILGIGDQKFAADARITFAKAITAAEAGDGELILLRWRGAVQC